MLTVKRALTAVCALTLHALLVSASNAQLIFSPAEFEQDRLEMLGELSRPIKDCLPKGAGSGFSAVNSDSPMFHGCWDWHSAVHAAYSLYAIYRHTGDVSYRTFVEQKVKPELMNAELAYMQTRLFNNSSEQLYGNSWFIALAIEREEATGQTDMRPLAEWAANRMRMFITGLTPANVRTRVLNTNYQNLSWALIHIDLWAKFTGNDELRQYARSVAQEYLFDPVLDGDTAQGCPITKDTGAASNFFSPCILRLAAVAKIYGAEQADWLRARIPDSIFVEPILVNPGDISHINGDNWSRAFGLWWIYQVTNQETVRANALRILVDHFAQPTHWDIASAYDVSHWVAQYAVRLIDSSFESNVPDTTPKLPLQLALGNSWALGGTGPLVNPNGYAARLQQTLQSQRGPIRLVDIGKATGTTTTANLVSRRLPYALDLLERSQLQAPAIRDAVLITLHTGFDTSFVTPATAAACGTTPPEQCTTFLRALVTQYTNAQASAANDWAQLRANLGAILSQLRAAAPRTRIVIGTYDNGYRDCNLSAAAKTKTQAIVAGYLEGGGPFGVGLNNVIRQVAAANGVSVAEISNLLGPGDWSADCFNPSDAGHAKIAQAFLAAP